jgi:hypothetical protein
LPHLAIMGDSVFDNAAYVGAGPSVIGQVNAKVEEGWTADLLARDGAVIADLSRQIRALPQHTTHAVLSIGGNDALGVSGVIGQAARSVADALERIAAIRERLAADYARTLAAVLKVCPRVAVCTIYDPNFPDPVQRRLSITGLCALNDVILRTAFELGAPVIDLRFVCDAPEHFANPIEPSSVGGDRIAGAIVACMNEHDFVSRRSVTYTK